MRLDHSRRELVMELMDLMSRTAYIPVNHALNTFNCTACGHRLGSSTPHHEYQNGGCPVARLTPYYEAYEVGELEGIEVEPTYPEFVEG